MSISYVKPTRTAHSAPAAPQAPVQDSRARQELRYWREQYERLTNEIHRAKVKNNDKWLKEKVSTSALYTQRASAVAQMVVYVDQVLAER